MRRHSECHSVGSDFDFAFHVRSSPLRTYVRNSMLLSQVHTQLRKATRLSQHIICHLHASPALHIPRDASPMACVRQASRACTLLCSSCNQREAPPQRSSFNKPSLSNPCMPEVLLSEKECFEKSYDAFSRSVDRSRVYMYACKLLTCRVRIVRDLHEPRHGC